MCMHELTRAKLWFQKNQHRFRGQLLLQILLLTLLIYTIYPTTYPHSVFGYDVKVDNNVDADSDIDELGSIGTSGQTYTNAQTKDGTYQNISE